MLQHEKMACKPSMNKYGSKFLVITVLLDTWPAICIADPFCAACQLLHQVTWYMHSLFKFSPWNDLLHFMVVCSVRKKNGQASIGSTFQKLYACIDQMVWYTMKRSIPVFGSNCHTSYHHLYSKTREDWLWVWVFYDVQTVVNGPPYTQHQWSDLAKQLEL